MTPVPSQQELVEILSRTIRSMLGSKDYPDAFFVNQGECSSFADAVCHKAGQLQGIEYANTLSVKYWRLSATPEGRNHSDWEPSQAPTMDETTWLKASYLPPGLEWKDLDLIRFHLNLNHSWLRIDNWHFDAEAPDGVASMFELPIMQRVLVQALRDENPALLSRLEAEHTWWKQAVIHEATWSAWWQAAGPAMSKGAYTLAMPSAFKKPFEPDLVINDLRQKSAGVVSRGKAPAP